MPSKSLACLVLGLLAVSFLWGQPPPETKVQKAPEKPADKPAIEPAAQRLIDQLADLDFHKRDAASRQLEALGAKAIPALRAASRHSDPEVRRRAADLLGPIEATALLAPKRVTLSLEKKTTAEVLEALRKHTDYQIDVFAAPLPKAGAEEQRFSFQWKDVPFWQALDELGRAAGLTVQQTFGDTRLHLQTRGRHAPYVCQAGAFCLVAGGFQETRTVDFSSFPRDNPEVARWEEMIFAFTVHAEPRLPLLSLGEPHLAAAYDNENNSMIPPHGVNKREPPNPQLFGYRPGRLNYGGNRTLTLSSQLDLVRPSPKSTSLKSLRGTVPLTILVEQKAEVVSDQLSTAKGKKIRVGTTTFVVEDLSETPAKQVQLRMTITEDAGISDNPNDYTWMNSLWGRLEVYDEKGVRMFNNGSSYGGGGPHQANMTLTYPAGGKPAKLVYQVWTTLRTQISFEFKDLPLP